MTCGAAASVATGISAAAIFGGLAPWLAGMSLALGLGVGWMAWCWIRDEPLPRLGLWDVVVLGGFLLAAFRAFFWVLFPSGDALKVLSPHNLGDMALHLGLIQYFASGIPFWPPSPLLVGVPLTYPPGADFFNALLLDVGLNVRGGLVGVGFLWALAAALALWRYGGAFAVAAFLFGGGLAGFEIFRTGEWLEYGKDGVWKNAFLTMLVTQRGFLFALPAGLALLWSWREDFFEPHRKPRIPLALQVLVYGTLPLFQLHTFLFLSLALAFAVAANPCAWRRPVRLAALAFLPATASVLAVTGGFQTRSSARWEPGWALGENGAVGFLLEFGVALALGIWLLWLVARSDNRPARWMVGVSALVALVAFLVPLTDWAWDNTKLLIWAWIAPAPYLWSLGLKPRPLAARAMLCALLFFGGSIALLAGLDLRHGYHLATRSELAEWKRLVREMPPETVFAITPDYNHPLLLLGRRAVCGYEGHLSSHGLDYTTTLSSLHRILAREPGWEELATSLGAQALALRASENPSGQPLLLPLPESGQSRATIR